MEWASQDGDGCAWIASFPTDAPFLPRDLVARMADAVERRGADMACAASGGRAHPVIGLWPIRLKELGRASGRERGGQYGLISVVDAHLKKKRRKEDKSK